MLRWRNGITHLALNLETAGSTPARSTYDQGPIGQWLGHLPFKQEKAGRNRLGSLRSGLELGSSRVPYAQQREFESRLRNQSGVAQRQGR